MENVDYELLPDDSFQKKWLRIYLERYNENLGNFKGHEVTDEELEFFMSAVQKFTLASHFLWGIWSLLQAEHSSLEFDFLNYALIRYTEYYKRKKQIFNC